jgi:hypothetical protein
MFMKRVQAARHHRAPTDCACGQQIRRLHTEIAAPAPRERDGAVDSWADVRPCASIAGTRVIVRIVCCVRSNEWCHDTCIVTMSSSSVNDIRSNHQTPARQSEEHANMGAGCCLKSRARNFLGSQRHESVASVGTQMHGCRQALGHLGP